MQQIEFRVYGTPQTKGSAKALKTEHMKFAVVVNDNEKNKGWAAIVSSVAQDHAPAGGLWKGSLAIQLVFFLYPPKALLKLDRQTKRPKYLFADPTKKPDIDKMTRSIYDALTGVIFLDDRQIIRSEEVKQYSEAPGVNIIIRHLEGVNR